ncbi:MAG: hypothetical protein A3G39_05520 [Deltaproteobacteria bacterium RIFCSPLOWO2_12_FULL_43_16]|nr:MAG: hypothetical protein A3D30_04575 [Deltaproteobacteria bacterium RIFCSPHIGHO2_02_FULL_43_33]OGQ61497.1 MAG: hypothetical protein A3G39_05520 [Deltaproteobacteria bacterium RIFCSPLOWO2_12_FULL_43_16]HBR17974.1 hypothetical protein [Deltaproteobacteria bacterium]
MECPRCGLLNPETALMCDCDYDFATQTVKSSYISENLKSFPKELGWRNFVLRFLGASGLYAVVSYIFNPYPIILNTFNPLKIVVYYLLQFMFIFLIISIPTVIICKISRRCRNQQDSVPRLLNRILIVTLIIGGLLIHGGWYANKR